MSKKQEVKKLSIQFNVSGTAPLCIVTYRDTDGSVKTKHKQFPQGMPAYRILQQGEVTGNAWLQWADGDGGVPVLVTSDPMEDVTKSVPEIE